jgi:hypothetical protein
VISHTRRRTIAIASAAILLATLADPSAAQDLGWVDQFGTDKNDVAWSIALGGSTLYLCGVTESALPGQVSHGEDDAFIRAYGLDGTETWTRQFGTSRDEQCFGVVAAEAGVSAVGRTFGKLAGEEREGAFDAYVRMYDAGGNRMWTDQFGTRKNDVAFSVAADPSGALYVVGSIQGRIGGQRYRGNGDAFVRKLDASGHVMWTRVFGSRGTDVAFAVTADATGVYIAGATTGALRGQRNRGEVDLFARAYGTDGRVVWTHQLGTDRDDYAYGVAVDGSGVYIAGSTKGRFVEPGAGGGDAVLVQLDPGDGRRVWLRQFGTDRTDLAFAAASDGSLVYVVGTTDGAFDDHTNQGERDAFVLAFDGAGTERWTYQFGSDRKDSANWVVADGRTVFLAGQTEGALPRETSVEKRDAFIASVG